MTDCKSIKSQIERLENNIQYHLSNIESENECIEDLKKDIEVLKELEKECKTEEDEIKKNPIYEGGYFYKNLTFTLEDVEDTNIWIEKHCRKYHNGDRAHFVVEVDATQVGWLASCVCKECQGNPEIERDDWEHYIGEV